MINVINLYKSGATSNNIKISNIDLYIKSKQTDGYYSRYSGEEDLLVSDTISELTNTLNSKPTATIQSGDKVYITKNSSYPALLLSRLKSQYQIDISRTITEAKADKFIFDKEPIKVYDKYGGWSSSHEIHLTGQSGSHRIICELPNLTDSVRLNFMKTSLEKIHKCTFYYAIKIADADSVKMYINHMSNAVDSRELIRYMNTFIPYATDSEIDTIFNFLKSTDPAIRTTGINLFTTLNTGNNLYKVIQKTLDLAQNYCSVVPAVSSAPSAWKFLYLCTDLTDKDLDKNFNISQAHFLRKIMQNPIYTGSIDQIKSEIKQCLLERLSKGNEFKTLREDLALINCEIILHDKDGKADTGN